MTPKQQEAFDKAARNYSQPELIKSPIAYFAYTAGCQAAQTPEMLLLNPLVEALVDAIESLHYHYGSCAESDNALKPFEDALKQEENSD